MEVGQLQGAECRMQCSRADRDLEAATAAEGYEPSDRHPPTSRMRLILKQETARYSACQISTPALRRPRTETRSVDADFLRFVGRGSFSLAADMPFRPALSNEALCSLFACGCVDVHQQTCGTGAMLLVGSGRQMVSALRLVFGGPQLNIRTNR